MLVYSLSPSQCVLKLSSAHITYAIISLVILKNIRKIMLIAMRNIYNLQMYYPLRLKGRFFKSYSCTLQIYITIGIEYV